MGAINFLFFSLGILMSRPRLGFMGLLSSDSVGGKLFRNQFPVTVLVLLVLFELRYIGQQSGYFSYEVAIALMLTSTIIVLSVIMWKNSRSLTAEDVQRKKAEKKMRELAAIVESSNEAIFTRSPDETILTWNRGAEKIFGYDAEEITGKHISTIAGSGKEEEIYQLGQKIFMGEDVENFETIRKKKDGSEIPVSLSLSPVKDQDGKVIAISVIAQDISRRKKSEEELKQKTEALIRSNKQLEQFAYISSHDLQEPLRTVSNFVKLLHKKIQGLPNNEPGIQEYMGFIESAVNRMQNLITGLLDLARIGRENEMLETDLNVIVNEAWSDLGSAVKENATFSSDTLPLIKGYPELKSVFYNLIGNAIKFRKKDNAPLEIRITVKDQGESWLFAVNDNGIGIEKKYYEKIFLIFQRLHNQQEYEGTGIGLAHCMKIIEFYNGKLWVESIPGTGSTFFFTVPKNRN